MKFACVVLGMGIGLALGQGKPDASKGNEVFDEQCSGCHHADREERKVGPGLKWLFVKGKLDSNGKAAGEASVLEILNKGSKGMPAFEKAFSDKDKVDLLAYLKTL